MVRNTLNIPLPSAGLNTEISDLTDIPQYSKEELNMDILSDGSRTRRLGLEYEDGYKLSAISAAESMQTESGQIVKIKKGFSCYEWANYKGDGKSLIVTQIGKNICFFNGVNKGVLSDEELDYTIDLEPYAISGENIYGWTVTTDDSETFTGYTNSATPSVGDKVYRDRAEEVIISTVESVSGGVYTLSDGSTMVYDSTKNTTFLSNNYINTPVSFTSAYGTLFICSPYIEVIKVKFKETYTYPASVGGKCSISLSPFVDAGFPENAWNGCTVIIETASETTTFELTTYGIYNKEWRTTSAFINAFNAVPNSLRQGFNVSGDGGKTYTFLSPAGEQYNGATVTLKCGVLSCWKKSKGGNWRDAYGKNYQAGWPLPTGKLPNTVDKREVSGVISGATTYNVTINGYREVSVVTPMVRDTSGIEEPNHPANDIMPSTLTNEHFYNLLNQGWDGEYNRVDDDTCLPWVSGSPDTSLKIYKFYNQHTVFPSNALSWFALKDANGDYAPTELMNCALGSSLAPRGKIIMNAYSLDRASSSGVTPIPPSPYADHRPEDITFFAGRLWYAIDGRVLYSQIISEDTTLAEKCYQAADPTSEDVSDPIDTDGGVMNIQQCGKILRIAPLGSGLCVFGDKGVVAILPGNATGFTPTSYYQQVVSSIGTSSKRSVISVGDSIYYWSSLGIHRVAFNENGQLISENISFGTIHTFFKNLKPISKENCVAKLNAIRNDIHFMYPTNEDSPKQLDGVLKYNIITGTWTPRSVPLTSLSSPFIVDAIELKNTIDTRPKVIVESNGATVLADGEVVKIIKKEEDYIGFDSLSYFVIDGDSMRTTFANCTNIDYKDWTIGDIAGDGYNFESFIITHPMVMNDVYSSKQAPYITTTYKRSEEGELFKSGCYMSARWDWASNPYSYKWDSKQQTYRLPADSNIRTQKFNEASEYVTTKTRVRGSGKALQLKFENDGNKAFRLCAIGIDARGYKK